MAPAVPAADDERGESNFTNLVARFDTSAVLASIMVISWAVSRPALRRQDFRRALPAAVWPTTRRGPP